MPSNDRLWYLDILPVCMVIALPIMLLGILGNDRAALFAWDDPSNRVTIMLVAIAVILLPLLSVLLCIGAARKLSRLWRRRRAVRGEWDALAVSLIIPDVGPAEQPQTLADNPLSLRWRATSHTRGAAVLYVGEALIAVLGDATLICGAALIVYAAFSDQYRARLATIPPYVLALVVAGPFVMTPLLILFARMLPTQFGRPFGVNADEEGISARTQFGARARLRWDDVRLVEISVAKDSPMVSAAGYAYTIYGPHSEIEWRDSYARESLPEYEPVGMTTGDAQSQARRLLAVAMARTGLPLRTLNPKLQSPVARPTPQPAPLRE